MSETPSINIRCFTRKDGERLEQLLTDVREGARMLRVVRMGAAVHVYLESKVDVNG